MRKRFALATLSVSTLLAQSQDQLYTYSRGTAADSSVPKKPATVACDAHTTAPDKQAMLNAAQALGADQFATAECWLRIAAAQGNSTAQGTLAIMLYTGFTGAPANPKEALDFAIKAATAHNYLGDTCLASMYAHGIVLEKDQGKSDFWRRAADRDELAAKQAKQNPAQEQTSRQPTSAYGPNGPQPSDSAQDEPYGPNGPLPIPQTLHFCAQHCLTFTMEKDGNLHNYTNLPGQANEHRILAVQKFTQKEVVIHRTDYGSYPGEGTMAGRMQVGNSSAIGEGWTISWGDALNTLPRDDQERAMRDGVQSQTQMSQAEQMSMLDLLFGLFSSGTSSSPPSNAGSIIGCAPGYSGCPHVIVH